MSKSRHLRLPVVLAMASVAQCAACRSGAPSDDTLSVDAAADHADAVAHVDAEAFVDVVSLGDGGDVYGRDAGVTARDADDEACAYPVGPYELRSGSTFPEMSWPSAIAGVDESGVADLERLRCEPGVHSIFIQAASTTCSECPARLRQIGNLAEHWRAYGARWVFVVDDVFTGSTAASAYIDRYGVTFGFRTNDADNSYEPRAIASSTLYRAVPWTGVVRASDMVLVYDEPDVEYLDIVTIAVELSGE